MSKARVAALAAVIIVPIVVLAIVLAFVLDNGDSGEQAVVPAPAQKSPPEPSHTETSPPAAHTSPGTRGSSPPDTSLSVLDRGSAPGRLEEKLAPASSDGTLALGDLRGTPIVLNIWSADCTPCRLEARVLQSEWERLGGRGVLFLGLNVLDSPATARRFRDDYDVTYPSLEEKRGATARSLGAIGVPETFFISKRGKVVGHVVGAVSLPQVELGVRAAQTGQPRPTDQGGGQIPLR
jgi:peroxiredoxin